MYEKLESVDIECNVPLTNPESRYKSHEDDQVGELSHPRRGRHRPYIIYSRVLHFLLIHTALVLTCFLLFMRRERHQDRLSTFSKLKLYLQDCIRFKVRELMGPQLQHLKPSRTKLDKHGLRDMVMEPTLGLLLRREFERGTI